jgi:DNA-binding NtrC family response regulator
MKHILIVDDERGSRESLRLVFSQGYEVSQAASAKEALAAMTHKPVDLVLLDVMMPEEDGVSFLKQLHSLHPDLPVIMVSASTSVRPAVEAMRIGACDYVTKPFDVAEIRRIVERALESHSLQRRVAVLQTEVSREFPVHNIIGESPAFSKTLEEAGKAAESDSTVLLYGESGTGKELIARRVHALSSRRDEPFVAVHCAALPETLMESELFGHEKGAFTNADKRKLGRFDLAGSGTLFFDEVGEMSAATQVKLLRVLQEREFMRVGGTQLIRTDARIVAATARDLRIEVAEKRFRDDLYYRLSVVPIRLPPLRERPEDIPVLCRYFLRYFKQNTGIVAGDFSPEAMELLSVYAWPGNVRELRNIIERMLVLHGNTPTIGPECLPEDFHKAPGQVAVAADMALADAPTTSLEAAVNAYERKLIENALAKVGGVQTHAAAALGTTRRILSYRMQKLGIPCRPDASP